MAGLRKHFVLVLAEACWTPCCKAAIQIGRKHGSELLLAIQVHTEQGLTSIWLPAAGCLRGSVSDYATQAQLCGVIKCLDDNCVPYCSPSASRTGSRPASDEILLQLSSAGIQ